MKNYYELLQVSSDSDVAEIREAYRRLVQQNLWNKDTFADLKEAYDVLTSPSRRAEYDKSAAAEGVKRAPVLADSGEGADFARRCPMGASENCPVISSRTPILGTHCPQCGVELASVPQLGLEAEEPMEQKWFGRLEEETGRQHRLVVGENTVGREGADINLPDKTISRLHARLLVEEDETVTLEDLGSTNGTQVNGERLLPHAPRIVIDGDTVRFGSVRLRFRALDVAENNGDLLVPGMESVEPGPRYVGSSAIDLPPVVPIMGDNENSTPATVLSIEPVFGTSEPSSFGGGYLNVEAEGSSLNPLERLFRAPLGTAVNARAKLVATRGDMISEHPLIEGITSFGRRADSTIVLRNDPYVSGSHAQITGEADTFELTDVGSTNGTLLNGERLIPNQSITLKAGDEIVIGGTIFRFEPNTGDVPTDGGSTG